ATLNPILDMNRGKENKRHSIEVDLNVEGLQNSFEKIKNNVFDLTAYDGKINAFQISPEINLANDILNDSKNLFQTDALKIDTDILNPSLGLDAIKSEVFDAQSIINVNEGISSLVNDPLKISNSVNEIFAVDRSWSEKFDPLKLDLSIDEVKGSAIFPNLEISTNHLASSALLSESTYLNLDIIGKCIESNFSLNATEVITDFSNSFSKFGSMIALENEISSGFHINNDLLNISSGQLLRSGSLLDDLAISDKFHLPHYEEKNVYLEQKEEQEDDELKKMLFDLNEGLVDMLEGAEKTINSSNPDKVRHFGTSLRELFTHVLHQLAPNNQVSNWTDDPNHFHNDRPTRKAKILYISRNYNNKMFQDFLLADVKSVLSFIDLFQGITHSVKSHYTEQQLKGMLIKMKGTLHFLISTMKSS
ncbi:hypothetical protein QA596_12805, partial [Balneolales bacterium ANBcel1]|nr:hypothetical protein [Balneolales bacterium ANBcel1]